MLCTSKNLNPRSTQLALASPTVFPMLEHPARRRLHHRSSIRPRRRTRSPAHRRPDLASVPQRKHKSMSNAVSWTSEQGLGFHRRLHPSLSIRVQIHGYPHHWAPRSTPNRWDVNTSLCHLARRILPTGKNNSRMSGSDLVGFNGRAEDYKLWRSRGRDRPCLSIQG